MNGKNIPIWRDRWSLQSREQALWPVRSQLLALGKRGAMPPRVQSPGQASPLPTGHWGRPPTQAAAQGPSLPPCPLHKAAGIPTSVFAPQLKAPLTALGLSGREAAIRKINQMSHQPESIRRVNVK